MADRTNNPQQSVVESSNLVACLRELAELPERVTKIADKDLFKNAADMLERRTMLLVRARQRLPLDMKDLIHDIDAELQKMSNYGIGLMTPVCAHVARRPGGDLTRTGCASLEPCPWCEIERLQRSNSELLQNDGAMQRRLTEVLGEQERLRAALAWYAKAREAQFREDYGTRAIDALGGWPADETTPVLVVPPKHPLAGTPGTVVNEPLAETYAGIPVKIDPSLPPGTMELRATGEEVPSGQSFEQLLADARRFHWLQADMDKPSHGQRFSVYEGNARVFELRTAIDIASKLR